MATSLIALLVLVLAVSVLVPVAVARRRRAEVEQAAGEPVLIDGHAYDAAEVLWSLRQANETPHLWALSGGGLNTTTEIVSTINDAMNALPPSHAADVAAAQLRQRRTSRFCRELLGAPGTVQGLPPALGDAAIIALAAHDPTPLTELGGRLLAHNAEAMMQLGHVPFFADAIDAAAGSVAEQGAHVVGHLLDAHVPVVSIVMAIAAAKKSARAGLDLNRVTENLMWEVGAKGGSIMAGAGIGTILMPGIGTVVGGLVGAIGGTVAANHGKRRHLRDAISEFRTSCEVLGMEVRQDQLASLAKEVQAMIDVKTTRLTELAAELARTEARRSWFQRTFRPTLGLVVASRAIELGGADIEVDKYEHQALTSLFNTASTSTEFRGYAWIAGHTQLDWIDQEGPDPHEGIETLAKVRTETTNLNLARR